MDISCERCRAEYEFDESRLTEAGVTVKCTTCGHVFRVARPLVQGIPLRRGGQPLPSPCPDIATLQRWIVENRILRTDEASIAGAPWRPLGEMSEFAPFFAVVARASQPSLQPVVQPPAAPPPAQATQQFRAFTPSAPVAAPTPPTDAHSTLQFRVQMPLTAASSPPTAETVATAQYRVPMQPSGPSPLETAAFVPPPSAAPADGAQFRVPMQSGPSPLETAAFVPPPSAPPADSTPQFRVPMQASAHVTSALPMPRPATPATPSAAPSTLEYRVPTQQPPAAVTAAMPMPVLTPPPAMALGTDSPDAQATLRYRTPQATRVDVEGAPAANVNVVPPAPAPAAPTPSPIAAARAGERPLPRPEFGDRDEAEPARPAPKPAPTNDRRPVTGAVRVAEPAWARSSADESFDPEIDAFQQRGRRTRMVALVLVLVAALGATFWFVVRPRLFPARPPEEAFTALERGRSLARAHALPKLAEAEESLREALRLAGGIPFAEAHGALAEVGCARAEQLLDASDGPGAKTALEGAYAEAKAAHGIEPEGLAARRAFVDYFRTAGNPQKAFEQAPVVERASATDLESKAQLAALRAKDPATLAAAESELAAVVASRPELVRARWWLAQARIALKQEEGALEAMQGILALVPDHARAKAFVDAAAAKAAPPVVAEAPAAADVPPPPVPEVPAHEPKSEPAKTEPKVEVAKATKAEPAKAEPAKSGVLSGTDIDKLITQAGKLLDRQKPQDALAIYGQVIAARPELIEAHYGRGVALFDLGRVDESIEAFQRSLKLNPRFGASMIVLGDAYKIQGRNAEAVRWYQKYLDVLPDGEDAAAARANIARLQ